MSKKSKKVDDKEIDNEIIDQSASISIYNNKKLNNMRNFLNNNCNTHIRENGYKDSNIIDMLKLGGGCCYEMPDNLMEEFFTVLEDCRKNNSYTMFLEKQMEYSSSMMLDFDIYQNSMNRQLDDKKLMNLFKEIIKILINVVNLNVTHDIYCLVIMKPNVVYKSDLSVYKDGFHLLIPSIKLDRNTKRFLINKIRETDIIQNTLELEIPNIVNNNPYSYKDILDSNSAHVTVAFVGSASKKGSPSYIVKHMYHCVNCNEFNRININEFIEEHKINICKEFSVNYSKNCFIKKIHYSPRDEFKDRIVDTVKNVSFNEIETNPIIEEAKQLTKLLSKSRSDNYKEWRDVLCALSSISILCKDVAEDFSKQSNKYSKIDFNDEWEKIITSKSKSDKIINKGSLYFWAQKDSPQRYAEYMKNNVVTKLRELIYSIRQGDIQTYDFANIVHSLLSYKYYFDIPEGSKLPCWFEFINEGDMNNDDRIYKWYQYEEKTVPTTMFKYISETVATIVERLYTNISNMESKEEESKNIGKLLTNLRKTFLNLKSGRFVESIIRDSSYIFYKRGISKNMNKNPMVHGLRNGVIVLSAIGEPPLFIQGYHNYLVSKFHPVEYIEFDPYDPITKDIIITLRSLFTDNESDSFEYLMYLFASTIDSRQKICKLIQLVGDGADGKSTICELHLATLGNDYATKLALGILTTQNINVENATSAKMEIKGRDMGYFSEPRKSETVCENNFKEITGGESLSGRKLRENQSTFKPNMLYFLITNFELRMNLKDYSLRRRNELIKMKKKFVNKKYIKENPNEENLELIRHEVLHEWPQNLEILSRYYSILLWFHFWLQKKYDNKLDSIPHKHIERETLDYFNRQDLINKFLLERLVKLDSVDEKVPFSNMIKIYKAWYAESYKETELINSDIIRDFKKSPIGRFIVDNQRILYIQGYRFLKDRENPNTIKNETYAYNSLVTFESPKDNYGVPIETPLEYYGRFCEFYEENASHFNPKIKKDKKEIIVEPECSYDENIDDIVVEHKFDDNDDNWWENI